MARGQLPRAYLRIDPNLDQHPDADGMLRLICAANRQIPRGRFPGREVLRRILGSKKRVDAFLAPRNAGKRPDVTVQADGSFYLDGWDEWNEGDMTVGDRMARIRIRRNNGVTPPSPDRIADRNSPSEASRRQGVKAEEATLPPRDAAEKKGALELLRCPGCGTPDTLLRDRPTMRDPGWWCSPKRGGCNSNFVLGDPRILSHLPDKVRRSVEVELERRQGPPPDPEMAAVVDRETRMTTEFYAEHGPPQEIARRCADEVRHQVTEALTPREAVERWLISAGAPFHVRIDVHRYAKTLLEGPHAGNGREHVGAGAPAVPTEAGREADRLHPAPVRAAGGGVAGVAVDAGSADAVQGTGRAGAGERR